MIDKLSAKQKKKLFDVVKFRIPLSEQEHRVISMICLFFSLDAKQLDSLSILVPGDQIMIVPNDPLQARLIESSMIYETKIKKSIGPLFSTQNNAGKVYPQTIIDFISEINPTMLQKSLDEQNIESSIMFPLLELSKFSPFLADFL